MIRTSRSALCLLAGALQLAAARPASGQEIATSQASQPARPLLSRSDGFLLGASVLVAFLADAGIREDMQEHRTARGDRLASVGNAFGDPRFVLPVLGAAWLTSRVAGQSADPTRGMIFNAGKAVGLTAVVTRAAKFAVGRLRPRIAGDADAFRPFGSNTSFPSGHTAIAFAVATSLADWTSDGWTDVAFYAGASLTGWARMNDDVHWLSDVVAGAAVGVLAAKWVSRRHHLPGSANVTVGPGTIGMSMPFSF